MTLFVLSIGLACAALLALAAEVLEVVVSAVAAQEPPDDAPAHPCDRLAGPPAVAARRAATAASDGSPERPWRAF